jgi:hypothetical protein
VFPTGCMGARSAIHVSTYTFSPTAPPEPARVASESSRFAWGAIAFVRCKRRSSMLIHFTTYDRVFIRATIP